MNKIIAENLNELPSSPDQNNNDVNEPNNDQQFSHRETESEMTVGDFQNLSQNNNLISESDAEAPTPSTSNDPHDSNHDQGLI